MFSLLYTGLYGQKVKNKLALKADTVQSDSIEYELIIIDPGFESWLVTKPSINYHSQFFFEVKNQFFVIPYVVRHVSQDRPAGVHGGSR